MLCFPLFVTAYLGYKLYFRTKMQDPATADLQSGRRFLSETELEMLDKYYAKPWYMRMLTYVTF